MKLRQSLEAAKSQQEATDREKAAIEDLKLQLETETIKVKDLNNALQREQRSSKEAISSADAEKRLLQEHLDQEREVNHHLKHDLDALQVSGRDTHFGIKMGLQTRGCLMQELNMSRGMRFPTMWYVRPAKAQTSLRICAD